MSYLIQPRRGWRARALVTLATLFALAGIALASDASAATRYIRTDGGDAVQCTGAVDAAYPGSGSAQACAWSHPFIALPPGGPARIAGGDTVYIRSGSYMIGLGAPGALLCHQSWSWDCFMTPIPSGPSSTQPTRLIGVGAPAPELWGTERTGMVLNLEGSSNIEISNLEITDHESCIDNHCHGGVCAGEVIRCNRASAPWGKWAGTGISARDSKNVVLRDLNIHGMANRGVFAGRLTDWTMERIRIRGNGWVGWDGDIPDDDSNAGEIIFRELELSWNGCGEKYPGGEPFGCWGQSAGGYGDGLGTGATAGHWIIEDSLIHHNTSDGLDLLYMKEGGRVTIRRTWAEGNAGNQLKTKGDSLIENSVVVGNCAYFVGFRNMQDGDHCRALGNALSIGLHATSTATLLNNTITSEGDCIVLSGGGGTGAALNLVGNVLIGQTDWRQPWEKTCGHYSDAGSEKVTWTRNLVYDIKNGGCPAGSKCVAPMLVNASLAAFDPHVLAGSPVIDGADALLAPANDHYRNSRASGAGPDIGAVEFAAAAGAPPPAPTPTPTPTPNPTPAPVTLALQVQGVSVSRTMHGSNAAYVATVKVVGSDGKTVTGALVKGTWSGAGVIASTGTSDVTGTALVDGGKLRKGGRATFCLTSVTATGYASLAGGSCYTSN